MAASTRPYRGTMISVRAATIHQLQLQRRKAPRNASKAAAHRTFPRRETPSAAGSKTEPRLQWQRRVRAPGQHAPASTMARGSRRGRSGWHATDSCKLTTCASAAAPTGRHGRKQPRVIPVTSPLPLRVTTARRRECRRAPPRFVAALLVRAAVSGCRIYLCCILWSNTQADSISQDSCHTVRHDFHQCRVSFLAIIK